MKKSYLLFLVLLFASCMKNEPNVVVVSEEPPALTADEYKALAALKPHHTIHYEDAMQQALEASTLFGGEGQTKSASKSILDGRAITSHALGLTKSDAIDVDTLIYLFNYANDEGYVFVSADERAPGVLAYIENGYFNIQDSIECPGTAMLFSGMEVLVRQEIAHAEFLKDSLGEIATAKYDAITKSINLSTKGAGGAGDGSGPTIGTREETVYTKQNPNYGTIVQTNWEQISPYNDQLPLLSNQDHAFVGCVPVVIAQIMAHYNYPQSYQGAPLYTSELRQYKNGSDFSTPLLKNRIARFNKFIFDNVNTGYDESGTSSNYEKTRWFLRALGYSTPWDVDNCNFSEVTASIDAGWLVYAGGYSHRTKKLFGYSYSGGHAWIIDHYTNITKTVYKVVYYSSGATRTVLSSSTTMHVHCNMGYEEAKNGYYIDGVFNTNDLPEVNTKSEAKGNFQYKVEVAPRIRPE